MRAYQMDLSALEAFYNTNAEMGLCGCETPKTSDRKNVLGFVTGVFDVLRSKLSVAFFVSLFAFLIAGIFACLNGAWSLLWITLFAFLSVFMVLLAECVILYNYKQAFYHRIDSKRELVSVLRGGQAVDVPADSLHIGDILYLESGTIMHCDARVFEADNLYADENLVFGSSLSAAKSSLPIEGNNITAEQQENMVWKGSHIASGTGRAVVTALDEDCYLSKTGGRKARRQHSSYYTKQSNISRIVTCVYLILVAIVLLITTIFGDSKIQAFLLTAVLSSLITLNPMSYFTEWSYYRTAKKLNGEGVLIRNIEAFDGMNNEKQIFFDADDLLEQRLRYSETISVNGDEKSSLSYFSLCMGMGYFSDAVTDALRRYDLDPAVLDQRFPVFRRERDSAGNWYSLFSKGGSSVVVAAGQWKLMLPLLSGLNDELKAKIEELEKQGKFVCALASDAMDFIPAKLDVDTLFGSMSLIALLVFDVVIDEETETVISRFQKVGTEVLLNSRYSLMFGKQLAELYHIKLADESSNQAIGFSNPQYLECGPAVYDCAPQNVRAQASVVIAVGIKAQSVIYRIKCLFCGLRRCLNFLSIVGVAVVLASMLHFLMGYDVEKLIFPLIPLPLCLLIPAYYLMETTRNCAQYNRSYFLGSFCAFSTIATVCMGFETSGLCLSLSFVLLSAYLLVSAHAYRKINPKDIIALALLFAFTLIPWVLLGTSDWLPAAVLALFPAIGAFLLDLFY